MTKAGRWVARTAVVAFAVLVALVVVLAVGAVRDEVACERAGGVRLDGVCVDRSVVIDLGR